MSKSFPTLIQINTRVRLTGLARQLGRPATLDDIPDDDLETVVSLGFDTVWLLGVWQTGLHGRTVSRTREEWLRGYREVLPDVREEDICGSPFAIQKYVVHTDFGGDDALARLRTRLRSKGLSLVLDFVPNHTAIDHPWVAEHPEYYVHGSSDHLASEPQNYLTQSTQVGDQVLAHGRDPYFPGWPDTVQLNYRHPAAREAMIKQLLKIAQQCDGVRCDMAMLLLPEVFRKTWGDLANPSDGTPPVDTSFWPESIQRIRKENPNFIFMAEVYWDLEWELQQEGFDYTYDKRLYDRLRDRDAGAIRAHLRADPDYQNRMVRFLENHDEPRAASVFGGDVHQAAAIVTFLVPGMRFFHQGQTEGRRIRTSIHLARKAHESSDPSLRTFYHRLLECLRRPELHVGAWRLLETQTSWGENRSFEQFVCFDWTGTEGQKLLVAVNFGPTRAQCYVSPSDDRLKGRTIVLKDLMSPARYERNGDELNERGLYLDMTTWQYHVFELT